MNEADTNSAHPLPQEIDAIDLGRMPHVDGEVHAPDLMHRGLSHQNVIANAKRKLLSEGAQATDVSVDETGHMTVRRTDLPG